MVIRGHQSLYSVHHSLAMVPERYTFRILTVLSQVMTGWLVWWTRFFVLRSRYNFLRLNIVSMFKKFKTVIVKHINKIFL